jgi:hypothetical protein
VKKSRIAILVAGALVAGLTLGGIGIADAATRASHKAPVASAKTTMGTSAVTTLSHMTKLSVKQIMKLRHQGKSFASIATSMGVDPAAVVDQMVASRQAHLEAMVAAGRMTAVQEQTTLDAMTAAAQTVMGMVPGSDSGMMSGGTTPSMPETGMPGYGTGAGSSPGSMMTTPAPTDPSATTTPASPMAPPAAPSTTNGPGTMMGSTSGMGR